MIAKVTRGQRTSGLMTYLVGPGRSNEHAEPHLVAGSSSVMAWFGDDVLSHGAALEIARRLDEPRRVFGTSVRVAVRDADGVKVGERDAHVWHCSLNVGPADGVLSDATWGQIAERFVEGMGFGGERPCPWVAVRHGASGNGNDHVHLIVTLVHEDGVRANVWQDRPRAVAVCGELEQQFGLHALASRGSGRSGTRAETFAEREQAHREGKDEPTRRTLERLVRAAADASVSEAEFVRRVRREGVVIRPRYASGTQDVVLGYSVALRPPAGQAPVWFGGGRLQRDLTLPRLRDRWADTPEAASDAAAEWNAARRGQRPAAPGREQHAPSPEAWRAQAQALADLRRQMAAVPAGDFAGWAHLARMMSGAFAAWSVQVEPTPGPLAASAAQLARVAQLRAWQERPRDTPMVRAGGTAMLFASLGRGGRGPVGQAALVRQMVALAQAVHDAMAARQDAVSAAAFAEQMHANISAINQQHFTDRTGQVNPGVAPSPPGAPLPPLARRPDTAQRPGAGRGKGGVER